MGFTQHLDLPEFPVILAPLAGVSDHPFRRACSANGADLTYVEMISATALLMESKRTLKMLTRHDDENILGVQITGKTADETARAIEILDKMPFDTIDINMGCPVKKVVKTGCGSAILKDPERVYQTVYKARQATSKPLSAKIRIGWDRQSINGPEVAQAIQAGGADWMTVHGRTRADNYQTPVDLVHIAQVKQAVDIPVVGNGNIFSSHDGMHMKQTTGIDGLMVSRGALGNPWVFNELKNSGPIQLDVQEWLSTVRRHLNWQQEAYGEAGMGAICMRKHLLWYTKGWPLGKVARDKINKTQSLPEAMDIIEWFAEQLIAKHEEHNNPLHRNQTTEQAFHWDPKFEMDRTCDRGIGDDGLEEAHTPISGSSSL